MGGAIAYPKIIGALTDTSFLVVPALKDEMAGYCERLALGENVQYHLDWNLVIIKSLNRCLVTLEILWDDGNISVIGFPKDTWEQLSQFINYRNLLLLPDRGLVECSLISPKAAEGFLIKDANKGLVNLAHKAANIPPSLNVGGLVDPLCNLLNTARKISNGVLLS
ncbi:hypothetical protein [Desulforamulus ruminis]|uniref:Uncharacterized protein n=1 Tax=Desulforamulus ruminis (strain ATCC 23193 / DSM 2154 / NCIMB 8452 / DL) TaxID=696281 RepID=F6DV48_DESRL|nr:hypothetical protein [Desulforamulus ruminis]AEG59114.1 hypothetical protein Desru_0835 [Desulforamulus ruminis DSM 2154]